MEVKDVLHYYLGCKVKSQEGEMIYTLSVIDRKGNALFYDGFGNDMWLPMGWKLILRPLSDMTEEEAIELAKLSEWEPHFRDIKVERNKFNDLVVTWDGMVEGGETFNATGECFYCAEQFHYLLSKGFDLFNLIADGKAIDSTIKQ